MFEFLGGNVQAGDFVSIQIFIGFQIGMLLLFNLVKRMRKEVTSFREYMTLVNLQYQQAGKIMEAMDKDPEVESRGEKIFRYVGEQLKTINNLAYLDEDELMSDEQKIQKVREKIINKVRFIIKEYEGENSELLNDKLILDTVGFVLQFVSPMIIKK